MPTFQFLCRACGRREDRIILYEEITAQTCFTCGQPLLHEFVPTRAKPIVYGRQSGYPEGITGPRQKARYLHDKNLLELGDAPLAEVHSEMGRLQADHQARQDAELEKAALEVVSELGGELYQGGSDQGASGG